MQLTLFRDSVLTKLLGALVLIVVSPGQGEMKCPVCNGTKFEVDRGWTECVGCYNFAMLTAHLEQMEKECC